jgi:hypothetical protein
MKRGFNLEMPDLRLVAIFCAGLTTFASPGLALTLNNPYEPIVGRNVFALKPPTPLNPTNTTPVVAPAGIELQGLTTILGRPQVLLKIKLPAKPPEPAKDQSVVLDVGQREGDVEVLAIDMAAGTVQIRNQGRDLPLDMKNAAKPTAGAAIPMAPGSTLPTIPGLPAPQRAPTAAGAGANVSTFGGGASRAASGRSVPAAPALPARSVRSNPVLTPAEDRNFRETQVALIEVEREIHKDNPKYPPPPPTPMTPNP